MKVYEPMAGDSIEKTAAEIVLLANRTNDVVVTKHNDIELKTGPSQSPKIDVKLIVTRYCRELSRQERQYYNSPKGKRALDREEKHRQNFQRGMKKAMDELDSLDLSNLNTAINWLKKVWRWSGYIWVKTPSKKIVKKFRRYGYRSKVSSVNFEDEESYARWLIGQVLTSLKEDHNILRVFRKFAREWQKQFGYIK